MWKLRYTDAHIKTVSWKFYIFNPYSFGLFTLDICHLSLKHSLLFNTFNSFNANIESFMTIYWTDIL